MLRLLHCNATLSDSVAKKSKTGLKIFFFSNQLNQKKKIFFLQDFFFHKLDLFLV